VTPTLTIVIVSFNTRDDLDACLAALAAAPPEVSHEVVVVDNASADGSAARVRSRWPGVRLIEAGGNLGFARANNLAIRQSSSELILLLNNDAVVPPGAIDALVRRLQEQPAVGVVGPRLVDGDGHAELSFGRMPGPISELGQRALVRGGARGARWARQYIEEATRRERVVDWVTGACLLVRRGAAEQAGLLDERYFMYLEDVDFCAAIRGAGHTVLFTPVAEVVHRRGRSGATVPDRVAQAWRESHLAFYEKHHPRLAPLARLLARWKRPV